MSDQQAHQEGLAGAVLELSSETDAVYVKQRTKAILEKADDELKTLGESRSPSSGVYRCLKSTPGSLVSGDVC